MKTTAAPAAPVVTSAPATLADKPVFIPAPRRKALMHADVPALVARYIIGPDDALGHQHAAMGLRATDILGIQSAIEVDGRIDPLHDGGGAAGKTAAPHGRGSLTRNGGSRGGGGGGIVLAHGYP